MKITFIKPYEGMCGRKSLEQTADPFEDVSIVEGETFTATIFEKRDDDVSFIAHNKGTHLKKGDRMYTVPVSCIKMEESNANE